MLGRYPTISRFRCGNRSLGRYQLTLVGRYQLNIFVFPMLVCWCKKSSQTRKETHYKTRLKWVLPIIAIRSYLWTEITDMARTINYLTPHLNITLNNIKNHNVHNLHTFCKIRQKKTILVLPTQYNTGQRNRKI